MIDRTANETRFRAYTRSTIQKAPQWESLPDDLREATMVVSAVLPFRTNPYVLDRLIDWDRVPDDPMFQLTFPQRGMLSEEDYESMADLVLGEAPREAIEREANRIRFGLNPHPAGQMTHNVPIIDGEPAPGIQHKYRETVLFFPEQGQTCHAYCTFCFRWAQFVGIEDLRFSNRAINQLVAYLHQNPDVTDVLLTGGDPMVMTAARLRQYIEPLLDPSLDRIQSIRIGTKSVAYWPQRFVSDRDADDMLSLFDDVTARGKHLAIMGHYCHPVELSTDVAQNAVRRIRSTGAQIRMQGPLLRHINDDPEVWAALWRDGVRLGAVPYYMFVERDTGARNYFQVPLERAWNIYRKAYRQVSGVGRTVRGPSMSAFPGKLRVIGVTEAGGRRVFALEYLQARNPDLVRRPFFAKYNPKATWYDDLEPAFDSDTEFLPRPEPLEPEMYPLTINEGLMVPAEE